MIDYPEAEEPTALKNQAVSGYAQTELRKIFFSEVQAPCVIHGCSSQLLPVCSNALGMLFLIGMPSLAEEQGVCCSFHSRACSCYCLEKCLQFKVDSLLHAWPPELSVGTISANNSVDTYWEEKRSSKLLHWQHEPFTTAIHRPEQIAYITQCFEFSLCQ